MGKRTLANCSLIKRHSVTIGKPNQYDGKCEGYTSGDRDEPTEACRECKLNNEYKNKI